MHVYTHMCVMCESQFLHLQKGNTNPFLLSSHKRQYAIQSFGMVNAWGPRAFSHIYLEKRKKQLWLFCSVMGSAGV